MENNTPSTMPFEKGNPLIANTNTKYLKKGKGYLCEDILFAHCHSEWFVCVGISGLASGHSYCPQCNTKYPNSKKGVLYHPAKHFYPKSTTTHENAEICFDILTMEIVEERSDVLTEKVN